MNSHMITITPDQVARLRPLIDRLVTYELGMSVIDPILTEILKDDQLVGEFLAWPTDDMENCPIINKEGMEELIKRLTVEKVKRDRARDRGIANKILDTVKDTDEQHDYERHGTLFLVMDAVAAGREAEWEAAAPDPPNKFQRAIARLEQANRTFYKTKSDQCVAEAIEILREGEPQTCEECFRIGGHSDWCAKKEKS